jgi:polar amino acid transport system permease protein
MDFQASIFWHALLSADYIRGAGIALGLASCAMIIGVLLGFPLALARMSSRSPLQWMASCYIGLFRGIPTLLILLVAWNAAPQLIPALRADWFSPFLAGLISLALVEAAYMAEIIRSALLSIDAGQPLAARALGMTPVQTMFRVIVPQVIRIAIPPTGSEFINTIKYTSLVSVISLRELLTTAQTGVSTTFRYAEYYSAAAVYYLIIVSVLTFLQGRLEQRYLWTSKAERVGVELTVKGAAQ